MVSGPAVSRQVGTASGIVLAANDTDGPDAEPHSEAIHLSRKAIGPEVIPASPDLGQFFPQLVKTQLMVLGHYPHRPVAASRNGRNPEHRNLTWDLSSVVLTSW